jgi:hypothetical protein
MITSKQKQPSSYQLGCFFISCFLRDNSIQKAFFILVFLCFTSKNKSSNLEIGCKFRL